jgi:hypothetical protein
MNYISTKYIRFTFNKDFKILISTATISLHRQDALMFVHELKNLVPIDEMNKYIKYS